MLSVLVLVAFIFAACADPQQPTATSVPFSPTVGGAPEPTQPAGPTAEPSPTQPPAAPDPVAGQATFQANCTTCHNTDSTVKVGPGLGGIINRAGTRVTGLSAEDYIRQSIMEPSSFVVDGFPPIMPTFSQLGPQDIENLLAYLATLN
jgi:mono/diheme cytochrome c family protein